MCPQCMVGVFNCEDSGVGMVRWIVGVQEVLSGSALSLPSIPSSSSRQRDFPPGVLPDDSGPRWFYLQILKPGVPSASSASAWFSRPPGYNHPGDFLFK